MRALVVDDFVYNLRIMRVIFQSAGFEVETATDGQEALDAVRARRPDFILTDILMPKLDGFQLCRAIKTDPALSGVPLVFYTGSYVEPADREFGMGLGAAAYLLKPMEPKDLLSSVLKAVGKEAPVLQPRSNLRETFATAYADRLAAKLQEKVTALNKSIEQLEDTYTGTVAALTLALTVREGTDPAEAERPARLALQLCERVAPQLAADPNVCRGFLLHDIGKLMLPEALLKKAGPLTPEERAQLLRQPEMAADILRGVPGLGRALEIVRHHHEHFDGTGHPEGLQGDAIPLEARIFAICHAFEAMTSERPYRHRLTEQQAIAELRRGAGTEFDPALIEPFIAMVATQQER